MFQATRFLFRVLKKEIPLFPSLLTVILCPAMSMSLQRKNRHHQNRKKTTEILSDASVRFISEKLTLRYSTPGTIVEQTSSTVSFRSLSTGDYILITQSDITINETTHRITDAEIAKVSDNVTWKKFVLENGDIVWCVL